MIHLLTTYSTFSSIPFFPPNAGRLMFLFLFDLSGTRIICHENTFYYLDPVQLYLADLHKNLAKLTNFFQHFGDKNEFMNKNHFQLS